MSNDVASPARTLLPSRELYRKAVFRDLLITVPLLLVVVGSQIGVQLARARSAGEASAPAVIWVYLGVVVVGVVFAFVYYFALLRNTRIDLGEASLTVTNWFGRSRTVNLVEVHTVIQAMVRLPARSLPMLFLLDSDGKRMLTMYGTLWPTDAMTAVGSANAVAPTTFAAPVTYKELRKLYPRAVSWSRANPVLLAVIIAATVFIVFIVVVVVLLAALTSALRA